MLGFMDYVQHAFYRQTHWDVDNSYSSLTATAQALFNFETPRGLSLNVSSLSSPNFATSYALGSIGVVDGSVSYLYSSLPLTCASNSGEIDLRHVIQGYRQLQDLRNPDQSWWWEVWHRGRRVDRRDTLFYGRMYLPQSFLEALYLRRLSPTTQLKVSCVSDSRLKNGGTILALLQQDVGKYSTECLYSTDSALFGFRGLYNFGPDPRINENAPPPAPDASALPSSGEVSLSSSMASETYHGRFSAGAEVYYGALNKSGGVSTGLRFTTLPQHTGFPYTMTLTLNPLMGNLASTYAVKAGPSLALCSQFGFNVYSYESDLKLGFELWRRRRKAEPDASLDWVYSKLKPDWSDFPTRKPVDVNEDVVGVLKAKVDQDWNIGVLWEGRIKELLFTMGASFDIRRRDQPFRSLGVELQYSS